MGAVCLYGRCFVSLSALSHPQNRNANSYLLLSLGLSSMRQQSSSCSVLGLLRTWRKGALGVKLIQTQAVGRGMSSSRAPELVHVEIAKDAPAHPDCLSRDLRAQGKGSNGNVNWDFSAVTRPLPGGHRLLPCQGVRICVLAGCVYSS